MAFLVSLTIASPALAGSQPGASPQSGTAFVYLQPFLQTSSKLTVRVGQIISFDMMVKGQDYMTVAQQSYLMFPPDLLQNVDQSGNPTQVVIPDTYTYDVVLQNEVCNGLNPCIFRGVSRAPGSFAFASGALFNPPAPGTFRVANVRFKGLAPGTATLVWQFSPQSRKSYIVDVNSNDVTDPALYTNVTINVVP